MNKIGVVASPINILFLYMHSDKTKEISFKYQKTLKNAINTSKKKWLIKVICTKTHLYFGKYCVKHFRKTANALKSQLYLLIIIQLVYLRAFTNALDIQS